LLVLLLLHYISPAVFGILQAAGGVLLLYFAWMSFQQWKHFTVYEPFQKGSIPRTLLQAAMVNILNPNPYLGWSLVLGPVFLTSWHSHPLQAVLLIVAFYTTMVIVLACTIVLFGTSRYLSPAGQRFLILLSTVILALIGVYQIGASVLKTLSK
jgi:threonine/homoserine/homoserine lactone efflux protein